MLGARHKTQTELAQGGCQVLEAHGCQKPWTELPCQVTGKDPGTPCHLIT